MVSLIVATLNRVTEFDRLLTSLDSQSCKDFELIIVDQNEDGRLQPVLQKHGELPIRHLHCEPGASRARNVGLRAAKGDLIGFPDDDCWYPERLVETVTKWFQSNPEFGGLFAMLRDENGDPVGPRWPDRPCPCTRTTLWDHGITPIGFLRRQVTDAIGFFDERLGPGAPSGYYSGEDTDYFLRPLTRGIPMCLDPTIVVYHPSFHAPDRLREKAYPYAKGAGYIMRTHGYPRLLLLKVLIRSLGGAVLCLFRLDMQKSQAYLVRVAGVLRGYVLGPRDINRIAASRR